MARGHGRVLTGLWEDEAFVALGRSEQGLYLFLLTQPNVSRAGILPLTEKRWSLKASDLDRAGVRRSLAILESAGFVVADEDEDELFICGFFDHTGIADQPRSVTAAGDAIAEAASFSLRGVASLELSQAVAKVPVRVPTGLRAQVLARDGWQCRSCGWSPGDPVPAAPSGRPLYRGLELDHIYPRSKGGPDTVDNLQVLCTSCNCRKGARV